MCALYVPTVVYVPYMCRMSYMCLSRRGHGRRVRARGETPEERLVFYCRTTSASTAPYTSRRMCCPTHCASYCAPCQPLLRAFSGWIRSPPPTPVDQSTPYPPPTDALSCKPPPYPANCRLILPTAGLSLTRQRPLMSAERVWHAVREIASSGREFIDYKTSMVTDEDPLVAFPVDREWIHLRPAAGQKGDQHSTRCVRTETLNGRPRQGGCTCNLRQEWIHLRTAVVHRGLKRREFSQCHPREQRTRVQHRLEPTGYRAIRKQLNLRILKYTW